MPFLVSHNVSPFNFKTALKCCLFLLPYIVKFTSLISLQSLRVLSLGMIRGHQTIMDAFVPAEKVDTERKNKKGTFTNDRNKCILYRMYYYSGVKKLRFDVSLEMLEKEFFVTASTLTSVISERSNELKAINEKKPSLRELRKEYPQFNWN